MARQRFVNPALPSELDSLPAERQTLGKVLRLLTFGGLAPAPRADGTIPRIGSRRLAVLAAVAAAGEPGITRDRLVGLFWPDVDEEHGRHSLRQALYALRDEAGPVIRQVGSSLFLDPQQATSDITEFHAALAAGDLAVAAGLYRGLFLEGFYLSGAGEFERWVETERARLGGAAITALRTLATRADEAGTADAAVGWWQRLTLLEPLSGRTAVAHARALVTAGDRARALAVLRAHEALVRRELDAAPDAEVLSEIAALRRSAPASGLPESVSPAVAPALTPPPPPQRHDGATVPAPRRPRWTLAAAGVLLLGAVGVGWWWVSGPPEVGTTSAVALRFYEEGLEHHRRERHDLARSLMAAAMREDSTFAMAAYYLAILADGEGWEERERALRLAAGAPPRQQMQIQADLRISNHDPTAVAAAQEWVARYPEDGEAHLSLARALQFSGDFVGGAAALERALALLETPEESPGACLLCDPLDRLAGLYFWWDSLIAVERTTRRQLARYPDRPGPLRDLALAAARGGDSAQALHHLRQLTAATESAVGDIFALRIFLTLEDYDQVEAIARRMLSSAHPNDRGTGQWILVIALRNQGRLDEARNLVRTGSLDGAPPHAAVTLPNYVQEAILAFEGGDPARAADFFEILRGLGTQRAPGMRARWLAWHSTLTATALAAAGDTATLRQLVDTVEYWGSRSLYGRDRKAHHFLRGLLLVASGRDADAVAEFRQGIHSPSLGYTRVNLELGRALLRLGRPAEAIPVLRSALRGEVDASNLYVTRTEIHEMLGDAFEQAGQADSARAHWQAVSTALARADPEFSARRNRAAGALRRLGQGDR